MRGWSGVSKKSHIVVCDEDIKVLRVRWETLGAFSFSRYKSTARGGGRVTLPSGRAQGTWRSSLDRRDERGWMVSLEYI